MECGRLNALAQYQKNADRLREKARAWHQNNREESRARNNRRQAADPDGVRAYERKWNAANRERRRSYSTKWKKANPERQNFLNAKRRAAKLQATPEGFDEQVREIYETCPSGWTVDHDIPLQNEQVCGWHHPNNLQHMEASENYSKGNIFDPEKYPSQGQLAMKSLCCRR